MSNKLLYNITMNVENNIEDQWLEWMKTEHLSRVMETGHFVDYKFFRIFSSEPEGVSYSIQFFANTMKDVQLFEGTKAPSIDADLSAKFGSKVVFFKTLLEEVG